MAAPPAPPRYHVAAIAATVATTCTTMAEPPLPPPMGSSTRMTVLSTGIGESHPPSFRSTGSPSIKASRGRTFPEDLTSFSASAMEPVQSENSSLTFSPFVRMILPMRMLLQPSFDTGMAVEMESCEVLLGHKLFDGIQNDAGRI